MPLYEFKCDTCGVFDCFRPISEASNPLACPTCEVPARRIYSTAGLVSLSPSLRSQIGVNSEPRVVNTSDRERNNSPRSAKGRPWMLSH
ncbi:FmdB family zinc ribbon protein [Pseudanabaena sp. PCC 6802]|uniref:FmdB family zinc ribbon protein n=1 Tax=Pseudanabaena sp. PCC 6802 TaxID=118173 RepID=UPI000345ECE1|nr:zinc ribbon domain-containing protein [Pseudanabaena sp. PCC 6802]